MGFILNIKRLSCHENNQILFSTFTYLAVIFFSLTLISAPIAPAIANICMGLTFIFFLFSNQLRNNCILVFKSMIGKMIIAWILCLLFFTLFTQSDSQTSLRELLSWRKFLLLPIGLLLFGGSFKLQKIAFVIISTIFIMLSFFSYILFFIPGLYLNKISPGIIMANYVAQALMFGITSLMLMVFLCLSYKNLSWKIILPTLVIIMFLLCNVFFVSSGRSGYIAIFIMFVTAWLMLTAKLSFKYKVGGIILILSILCLVAYNSTKVKDRIELGINEVKSGLVTPEYTSVGLRITFYKETVKMIPRYIILGAGTGGFLSAYTQQVSGYNFPANEVTPDPHNQYLRILIEQGIVGLLIFLILIVNMFFASTISRYAQILGVSVLVAWLVTSIFNSHFANFNEGVFIWGWLGLCFASPNKAHTKHTK